MSANIKNGPERLHARLFARVANEVGKRARRDEDVPERYMPPDYDTARDLILQLTKPQKDPQTGLWYYAGRDFWEYRGRDEKHYESLIPEKTEGFFQVFWPAGRLMAQKMAGRDYAHLIDGKCVLSIGPGSGLAEIAIMKKREPRLVACIDSDVFARAAFQLNAEANNIETGNVLVMLHHPDALKNVRAGGREYRLFDTVLAADCLYGKGRSRRDEARELAQAMMKLNRNGADVVIAERDEVKAKRQLNDWDVDSTRRAQEECGLTKQYLIAEADFPFDLDALNNIGLSPRRGAVCETAIMHRWPASEAARPLPRLDMAWWKKPAA